ncbi:LuxR C-terminal-related transcriptional regulator [Quadrisphaera sp. DSM 44207]|uniref:helix-turn-helix transcriptional regulator n=1 Tax=Quadrisphaera sp. DSM 44207 TaxID=1881057 RepID=UPI00088C046F|nr:LuxR C-terminal-related transcriptional regulator [Quadrisphaera sp. DSM 44207]SDQ20819.1 DNA-binding response regulator, NarL/FixJ family, contains REC and HTH domains [Quadrisphaera sp. DSM 44207]
MGAQPIAGTTGATTPRALTREEVLALLGEALRRQDEVAAELAGRCALHHGASLLTVFEAVLADAAALRTAGAGLLDVSDADVRARRIFCRLGSTAPRTAEQGLLFVDRVDATTVALLRLLEDGGLRVRTAVTSDAALVLDLTAEQTWSAVVVDHSGLRRDPRAAAQLLAPLAGPGAPRVVVTTERWDAVPAARGSALTWTGRDLRSLAGASGVVADNPLTEREREVLTAVAAGRSNEQVGRQLRLSLSTVKTYLERIHAKLGSVDRASAVAAALRRGWI